MEETKNNKIEMFVVKRDNTKEIISYDKIFNRTKTIGDLYNLVKIDYNELVLKIMNQLYNNIPTYEIDELVAQQCASMGVIHYEYSRLASLISISNHQKEVKSDFKELIEKLYNEYNYISETYYTNVIENHEFYESIVDYSRDYLIDYFGFKTLERAYLIKMDNKIVERIQHLWLRVAIQIHGTNLEKVKETYDGLSQKHFIHATPTLFNSGLNRPQLSSCFLLAMEDDSIEGIFNTLKDCANISKWAGGIGLNVHNIRSQGSHIQGTNGTSNGIVPMLRVFNNAARYVDQGGGKRNGSFAIYLEPWHADIDGFLDLRKNHGDEEARARDLFYALWIPDLFMKKVKNDDYWYLMCPNKCPNLHLCYGEKFETLYQSYVDNGKYEKKIKARELWFKILDCQMETGTPYMLYKDACNEKSNQKNLGTIRSSNLCCEIIEYSDHNESAVCNLASISLSSMVDASGEFDYDKLYKTTQILTENLNNVIDLNYYPTFKTENSNQKNRPIGIGVQGLADVFALMNIPFHSDKAREINKNIFETMYYASLQKSMVLSSNKINDLNTINKYFNQNNNDDVNRFKMGIYGDIWKYNKDIKFENNKINDIYHKLKLSYNDINLHKDETFKGAYSTFKNSPLQKGLFQFDLWNVKPSNRYNWEELREYIKINGVVNSLLIAPMPTASTSQILGNNECFEPFTSNMYTRRTLAGEFLVINKYLINDLIKLNIWNVQMKDSIIEHKGSIQNIPDIPEEIKNKYKIVWEIPMKHIINMAKDRGAFICQSQSMNLWVEEPNYQILTSMHMYSWSSGLKTGLYYLRRKAKHQAQQFTIIPENKENNEELSSKSDECLMCGS